MMNIGARQIFANGIEHANASFPIVAGNLDLDQLVSIKVRVDLFENSVGKPAVANQYHGFQGVGGGAESASLGRGNFKFRHNKIVR